MPSETREYTDLSNTPRKEHRADPTQENIDKNHQLITHQVGSDEVTIRSNSPNWGAVPVNGREHLKVMRDSLIEICKMENID